MNYVGVDVTGKNNPNGGFLERVEEEYFDRFDETVLVKLSWFCCPECSKVVIWNES